MGGLEQFHALCILALNNVNDKIFCVLWWWFATIFVVGALCIFARILPALFPCLRFFFLCRWGKGPMEEDTMRIRLYVTNCSLGQWFLVNEIGNMTDRKLFVGTLVHLAR